MKGFFVNVYTDRGTTSSTYHRTEKDAQARAERMRAVYSRKHPDYIIEISKTRAPYKALRK